MNIHDKVAKLLEEHYAYLPGEENKFYETLKRFKEVKDIKKGLALFNNKHLFLVEDSEQSYRDRCVYLEEDRLVLKSFWCQAHAGESPDSIRTRFTQQYKNALEKAIKLNHHITLDVRGNGGGGDLEMEFALYPFIEEGAHLYNYQFKTLSSPKLSSRILSKLATIFHLKSFFKKSWDSEEKYFFKLKEENYRASDVVKIKELKSRMKGTTVTILVDKETGSASELFSAIMFDLDDAKISGERTKGSVGAPEVFQVNDYKISIPTVRVWRKNGELLEGRGLNP